MTEPEYLVSYGHSGDFARFRCGADAAYRRGDRVVVRSHQGLELGVVLCPATDGHARFLNRTARGELLRMAGGEDERAAEQSRRRGQHMFEDGRRLVAELGLPLEILDVEVLLDGTQAVVHHLRGDECDYRPLVSGLSKLYEILVTMQNLAVPKEPAAAGCGKPGCGQAGGGGGCSSCGSGGCGTCGKATSREEVAGYLAGLRQPAKASDARTPLL
ncbi:MAG TPA: PSP1 C-terminal domain-containing protein [Gemmataceae bacterium]|jgi:cell fate regulator YaaT (PSP1 superfamily)|nr:PSP1 C-terminal domain-containing protein [Gemmataceae bacterium]